MEAINLSDRLSRYMDAGFPILYLNTFEEKLAIEQIQKAATTQKLIQWSYADGYSVYSLLKKEYQVPAERESFLNVMEVNEPDDFDRSLFVIKDAATVLEDPVSVAYLKELAIKISSGLECTVILLSPILRIPKELENFITILEMEYQTEEEIRQDIQNFCSDYEISISDTLLKEMALNFKGLTKSEIFSIQIGRAHV